MSKTPSDITLDLLLNIRDESPEFIKHSGGPFITIGKETPVTYMVVGWDGDKSALKIKVVKPEKPKS